MSAETLSGPDKYVDSLTTNWTTIFNNRLEVLEARLDQQLALKIADAKIEILKKLIRQDEIILQLQEQLKAFD